MIITIAFSFLFIKPVMTLLSIPKDIFDNAYSYVIVVFLGSAVTACYNAESNLLRAMGNSATPIVFLVVSSVLNIGLDILFIKGFGLGVMGASLATVVAQFVSVVLCMITIYRGYREYKISKSDFAFDKSLYSEMLSAGMTMALMNCIFAIGSLILQGAINGLGKSVIAGHLAARKIAEMFMQPMITIGAACSTFVSQNYGAGKMNRIKTAIKNSIFIELGMAVVFMIVVYIFAVPMINAMTDTKNELIISTARQYLFVNLPFYLFLGVLYVLRTSLQSIGMRVPPLASSSIELFSKVVSAFVLTSAFGYIGVCVAEPISWALGSILLVIVYATKAKKLLNI